jgi:hypothetical protein
MFLSWWLFPGSGRASSRFGAFNSRLGRCKFPIGIATGIRLQGLDLQQRFCAQTVLAERNSKKCPFEREKPGILLRPAAPAAGADSKEGRADRHPPSSLGMKKISQPSRIGWK